MFPYPASGLSEPRGLGASAASCCQGHETMLLLLPGYETMLLLLPGPRSHAPEPRDTPVTFCQSHMTPLLRSRRPCGSTLTSSAPLFLVSFLATFTNMLFSHEAHPMHTRTRFWTCRALKSYEICGRVSTPFLVPLLNPLRALLLKSSMSPRCSKG